MPPKYFAFIDGEQKGPFSLDQLADAGVRPSTYVWCKGMDDWDRADHVEEIRNLFRHHIQRKQTEKLEQPANPQVQQPGNTAEGEQPPTMRFPLPPQEEEVDLNRPPQVSMTLAVMSLILCFLPTGIAAVYFTYRAQKTWEKALGGGKKEEERRESEEEIKKQAHEYERLSKMWLGLTVAFGIIFWTLVFSIPRQ